MDSTVVRRLEALEKRLAKQEVKEKGFILRALAPIPDGGVSTATTSPVWTGTTGLIGGGILWRAADATQNFARLSFVVPAGYGVGSTLVVKGRMCGTAVSENTIIKTYSASVAAGDSSSAWDTSNNTEQGSIALAATWVDVTILTITVVAAGDVIALAFRPRTTGDANVTQNKTLLACWLQ